MELGFFRKKLGSTNRYLKMICGLSSLLYISPSVRYEKSVLVRLRKIISINVSNKFMPRYILEFESYPPDV